MKTNSRVVVAMSGGVDSSVAAWLLKEQGHEVIGVTIQTWSGSECRDERSKGCCSIRDIDDARSVARKIGIPYYVMDLSSDFKEKVIDYFVDEYLAGRTPNPCVECNRRIKFGVLLEKARELDAPFVATGHYARKEYDPVQKRHFIRRALDPSKDQSYVLFGMNQDQLAKTLLPIGDLPKTRVREMAGHLGLRVHDKPDSQEICFVKSSYGEFVRQAAPARLPGGGRLVSKEGETLGVHEGSHLFTIGQRKRIRLTHARPYFVTAIDPVKNEVRIGFEEELLRETMVVRKINWLLEPAQRTLLVQIRYKHVPVEAEILRRWEDKVEFRFQTPQKAVTPGQAAVFYDGDRVLGGGWIE